MVLAASWCAIVTAAFWLSSRHSTVSLACLRADGAWQVNLKKVNKRAIEPWIRSKVFSLQLHRSLMLTVFTSRPAQVQELMGQEDDVLSSTIVNMLDEQVRARVCASVRACE